MLKVKKGIHFALNGASSFSFETRGEILSDFLGNIHTLTAGLDCWTNSRSYQPAVFLLMLTEWYVCTCILACSADIEHNTYTYFVRRLLYRLFPPGILLSSEGRDQSKTARGHAICGPKFQKQDSQRKYHVFLSRVDVIPS